MKKAVSGFTIVELLIVIVVIAILAAISVIAYTGIQQRAQNTKSIAALRDWAQIIRMYKADSGGYPTMSSCLGSGYGRGFSGNESTGGYCREDSSTLNHMSVNSSFMNLMNNYVTGAPPAPSFTTAGAASWPWYRGLAYNAGYTGSKDRIDMVLAGSSTECPQISGMIVGSRGVFGSSNSVRCVMQFADSEF